MRTELLASARPLYMLIVDLLHQKDTRRILADLHARFADLDSLREALGPRNLEIITAARQALEAGNARDVGALMTQAQEIFDRGVMPACPSELAAPRLHAVLQHAAARELTWGGKGVGSQGDGAAQFVCRGPEERHALARRLTDECAVHCLPLTIKGAGDQGLGIG
jgi:galactokinase